MLADFLWWQNLLLLGVGLLALFLLVSLPRGFYKFLGYLLLNGCLGFAVMLLLNLTYAQTGIMLPINLFTLAISCLLGLPGVAAVTAALLI